jgi:hypothetical protein
MKHIDKSVRDHNQQAIIVDDTITIKMRVGREVRGTYSFPLTEWQKADNHPTFNKNWNRLKLIEKYTKVLDNQDGGECQAARIRDSQITAITKALEG